MLLGKRESGGQVIELFGLGVWTWDKNVLMWAKLNVHIIPNQYQIVLQNTMYMSSAYLNVKYYIVGPIVYS